MSIVEYFLSALRSLRGNKMRSILTMLGVIIGISSVISIMSLGSGVKETLMNKIKVIDNNLIQVWPMNLSSLSDYITDSDANAIKSFKGVSDVVLVYENYSSSVKLERVNETRTGSIVGVSGNYTKFEKLKVKYGRFIVDADVENKSKVTVLTDKKAIEIFGYDNCVGKTITVENSYGTEKYTVVGVISDDNDGIQVMFTPAYSSLCILPISTMQLLEGMEGYLDGLLVIYEEGVQSAKLSKEITTYLEFVHENKDAYYVSGFDTTVAEVSEALDGVTYFVAFVAFISLFVGGVGVMNIMLVTVTERTREIGIRKSLGATNTNIQIMFVIEAIFITLIGGIIGIIFGVSTATILAKVISILIKDELYIILSSQIFIISIVVSMLTGVISGVYPAYKAAKLNPIDALRYE